MRSIVCGRGQGPVGFLIVWIVKQTDCFENWEKQQRLCRFDKRKGKKQADKPRYTIDYGKSAQKEWKKRGAERQACRLVRNSLRITKKDECTF